MDSKTKRNLKIAGRIAVTGLCLVVIIVLCYQFNTLNSEEEHTLTTVQVLEKDLLIHFIAALFIFVVATILYKPLFSLFFEENNVDVITEAKDEILNAIKGLTDSPVIEFKEISFEDAYFHMANALNAAMSRVYVTSFIAKNPETIPGLKNQKKYHLTLQQKLLKNPHLQVERIVAIQNIEKRNWILEKLTKFQNAGIANVTVYHLEEASLLNDKKYLPINVQVYDNIVIIINKDCINPANLPSSECLYIRNSKIADFMVRYFKSLKHCCEKECLYSNGRINQNVVGQIKF